ncbi:MAG: flavin reductase family protein [Clostridia bacterium]
MKVEIEKKGSLNPMPKVIVTVRDNKGNNNALVVGYCGNCSYAPPMVMIGIVPTRYSYHMVKENGCFVVHLVLKSQKELYDVCGKQSGKDGDKLQKLGAKLIDAKLVNASIIEECPVAIECTVVDSIMTGSHEMFIGKVECVHAEEKYLTDGKIDMSKIDLM